MLAILIVLALVGVLTFYQTFTQGLFSTFIMSVLCVISALVAFNYYELAAPWVGLGLAKVKLGLMGGEAPSLLFIFGATLGVLRTLTDRYLGGNIEFGMLVDRIGGAFFGLVASLVMVGMVATGFELMPVGASILGFDRYPDRESMAPEKNLFPNADGFVTGLAAHASTYGFSGRQSFAQVHPDLLKELYLNRVTLHSGSERRAETDSLRLEQAWVVGDTLRSCRSGSVLEARRGDTFLAVRVTLGQGAADSDGKIRFVLGDFRLLGFDPGQRRSEAVERYAKGVLLPGWEVMKPLRIDEGLVLSKAGKVDLVYEWPSRLTESPLQFVEFKRSSWASMPSAKVLAEAESPEASEMYEASRAGEQASLEAAQGAGSGLTYQSLTVMGKAHGQKPAMMRVPSAEAVKKVRLSAGQDAAKLLEEKVGLKPASGGAYVEGHVAFQVVGKGVKGGPSLSVPSGYVLVTLEGHMGMRSGGGATGALARPVLVDSFGREYASVGYGMEGKRGGAPWREFSYSVKAASKAQGGTDKAAVAYPEKVLLSSRGGSVSKATFFYLVAQGDEPVAIVGAVVRQGKSRSEPGQVWSLSGEVDYLAVPSRQ